MLLRFLLLHASPLLPLQFLTFHFLHQIALALFDPLAFAPRCF